MLSPHIDTRWSFSFFPERPIQKLLSGALTSAVVACSAAAPAESEDVDSDSPASPDDCCDSAGAKDELFVAVHAELLQEAAAAAWDCAATAPATVLSCCCCCCLGASADEIKAPLGTIVERVAAAFFPVQSPYE